MKEHEKKYKSGQSLLAAQVAEVLSENSGYAVPLSNISHILRVRGISGHRIAPHTVLYLYDDIKDVVVVSRLRRSSAGADDPG